MIELSIVIPAYNEAKRLPKTLQSIFDYFSEIYPLPFDSAQGKIARARNDVEIIVVDDGSEDDTAKRAKRAKRVTVISYPPNRGKGYAVKTGIMAAKGQYILMMDADGSIPISELDKLWPDREQFDIVIGSRFLAGSRFGTQNVKRMIISKIGNVLFRILFRVSIRDTQCGFKLFHADAAKKIFQKVTIDRFGFDMEVLVLAKKFGYTIKEVPINWHDSPNSSVRAVRSSWQTLKEMLNIWLDIKIRGKPD